MAAFGTLVSLVMVILHTVCEFHGLLQVESSKFNEIYGNDNYSASLSYYSKSSLLTYFFSPSSRRNDSKAAGAFIMAGK